MTVEVVLDGLETPEGPVCLSPGVVAFGQQLIGEVSVFDGSVVRTLSRGSGSPNGLALGANGCLYVAQNGGVVGEWRARHTSLPSVEKVGPDGRVSVVGCDAAGAPLVTPNDLAFGPDGRLFVTDPGGAYGDRDAHVHPRIVAFDEDGGRTVVATGAHYPNGLAVLGDGALCWVESYTRRVRVRDGGEGGEDSSRTLAVLPDGHVPDGMAVAGDGRIFIATVSSHGIAVLSPDGVLLDVLALDDRANPTNLCFDGAALWVTDFGEGFGPGRGDGRLWRVDTDAMGLPLHTGSLPDH